MPSMNWRSKTATKAKTISKTVVGALAPTTAERRRAKRGFVLVLSLLCLWWNPVAAPAADGYMAPLPSMDQRPSADDSSPACHRYGRCDRFRPREERLRDQRLDRLAPQAPETPRYEPMVRREVAPTAEAELQPRYKEAGTIKEEFNQSGSAKPPANPQP